MNRRLAAFVLALALFAPASARAKDEPADEKRPPASEHVYLTREKALAGFFPDAEKIGYERKTLTGAQAAQFRKDLGYAPPRLDYVVYIATKNGKRAGYALIDNELGKYEMITFAVAAGTDGRVADSAVMVYREEIGHQVKEPMFLEQFKGKGTDAPLRLGRDVNGISGATVSSRSIARGIRRALWLINTFYPTEER
ncbi:FMN-binding protein [bacterium]|nr:FMN-binding protein [bacterium]